MSGVEWMVDAHGCRQGALQDPAAMVALFEDIVRRAGLHPIGAPAWHQFPDTDGITAVWMLRESHLTIHTFPEFQSASLNLFCCSPRACPDWCALMAPLDPTDVHVQECRRRYGPAGIAEPR